MPTSEKPLTEAEVITTVYGPPYQRGYDDGLQEGEKRGWEMGREAAAEWHDNEAALARKRLGNLFSQKRTNDVKEYALQQEFEAAAIRKLKKP